MNLLLKGFGAPASTASKQARSAATAGATAPAQAPAKGGIQCAMCDHYHQPGNTCSYMKSVEGLFDMHKAAGSSTVNIAGVKRDAKSTVNVKVGGSSGGGIPGHTGGNPHHGPDGKFTTAAHAVTATPAKGKPAVPVEKPKARPIKAGKKDKAPSKGPGKATKQFDASAPKPEKQVRPNAKTKVFNGGETAVDLKPSGEGAPGPDKEFGPGHPAFDAEVNSALADRKKNGGKTQLDMKPAGASTAAKQGAKTQQGPEFGPGHPAFDAEVSSAIKDPSNRNAKTQKQPQVQAGDTQASVPKPHVLDALGMTGASASSAVPAGDKTGAASPRGAKKVGGKVAGEEKGSGGVTGATSDTDPDKTGMGGSDDAKYLAARDSWMNKHPGQDMNTMPGSSARTESTKDAQAAQTYAGLHETGAKEWADEWAKTAAASGMSPEQVSAGHANAVAQAKAALTHAESTGVPASAIKPGTSGMVSLIGAHDRAKMAARKNGQAIDLLGPGAAPAAQSPQIAPQRAVGSGPMGLPAQQGVEGLFDDASTTQAGANTLDPASLSGMSDNSAEVIDGIPASTEGATPLDPAGFDLSPQSPAPPSEPQVPPGGMEDAFEPEEAAAPGGGKPSKMPMGTKQEKPSSLGMPISQMYGAGSSIGAGVAGSPGGGVPGTAAFAAQRAHSLLNPQMNRGSGPALATAGSGGGRAAWAGSTKHAHAQKSLLELFDVE